MYYLGLYWTFIKISLKTMVEYRTETIIMGLAQIAGYFADFLVIAVMVSKFQTMGGWNAYEIMLLYAFNLLAYAVASLFLYRTCNNLAGQIRTGELDAILTKPTNPLMYLCTSGFVTGYWAHILLSLVLMCFCFLKLGVAFTFSKILLLILSIIGGALIQGAIILITTVPAFWTVKGDAIREIPWVARDFIQYPITIYHKAIQFLLTFVVPYAFISFFPLQYFLGKNDFSFFHPAFQFLTPIVGIVLFFLAYRFWLYGLKHYNSSGS